MFESLGALFGASTSGVTALVIILSFVAFHLLSMSKKKHYFLSRLLLIMIVVGIMLEVGMSNYSRQHLVTTKECIVTDRYQESRNRLPLVFDENVSIVISISKSRYGYGVPQRDFLVYPDIKDCNGTKIKL